MSLRAIVLPYIKAVSSTYDGMLLRLRSDRVCITLAVRPCPGFKLANIKIGSTGWDRTTDTLINSQLQLPLCYCGILEPVTSFSGVYVWAIPNPLRNLMSA